MCKVCIYFIVFVFFPSFFYYFTLNNNCALAYPANQIHIQAKSSINPQDYLVKYGWIKSYNRTKSGYFCESAKNLSYRKSRVKRYVLEGSRWKIRNLSYRISKYPPNLSIEIVDREISRAFEVWEKVVDLTFTHKKAGGNVHIDIRFERGDHGDDDNFDGRGNIVAHSFFPYFGGDIHFDGDEDWTADVPYGINLFQVASHEIGHALGLRHSEVKGSLMDPMYKTFMPDFQITKDDIIGIQQLYGPKDTYICHDPRIDAITQLADGHIYAFKGSQIYKIVNNTIASGFPRNISDIFPTIPNHLDAVIRRKNGKTYFIKKNKIWRATDMQIDSGYPQNLIEYFEGVPSNIESAFAWVPNDKMYFFREDKFWVYDPLEDPPIDLQSNPKRVSSWNGVPSRSIEAILSLNNGFTYFFKGNSFWTFDNKKYIVVKSGKENLPVDKFWFGCS